MAILVTRRRLMFVATAIVVVASVLAWFFHPDRRLARSWNDLLAAVDARQAGRLRDLLALQYSDRWGNTRQTLTDDARLAFLHVHSLAVRPERATTHREGDVATITAILRVDIEGPPDVGEVRVRINSLFTPFTFEWRREQDFPWAWELVRFDQPELDFARLGRGYAPGF